MGLFDRFKPDKKQPDVPQGIPRYLYTDTELEELDHYICEAFGDYQNVFHEIASPDEPLSPDCESYARGSDWLLHEAFCLYSQADVFDSYEKHHSTVKDACELAEKLGVKNLLLYHTEDRNLLQRKELCRNEGSAYYHGNLFIPEYLETTELSSYGKTD